jgi:hypothetical protein
MHRTRSLVATFLGLAAVAWAITADAKVLIEKTRFWGFQALAQWSYSDATTTTFVDLILQEFTGPDPGTPLLFLTVLRQALGGSFLSSRDLEPWRDRGCLLTIRMGTSPPPESPHLSPFGMT